MSLRALGWNSFFEEAFAPWAAADLQAARVAIQHRGGYEVWTADEVLTADVTGRFRHLTRAAGDYPAVGDWVAVSAVPGEARALIHAVLPRRSKLSRNAPGVAAEEQLIVTNVDDIFVLEALAGPPNIRRIERFLTMASACGAEITVVLTKSDLCKDPAGAVETVMTACPATGVLATSSISGDGLAAIRKRVRKGRTIVLLGRSGAGKSTLINQLVGEETQPVLPVREADQKGRHATTSREMVFLKGGGIIIDTPGLRELQLWESEEGMESAFPDVEALALTCRFPDCRHETEPGCAVTQAVKNGALPASRLAGFAKLRAEVEQLTRRREKRARADEQRRARRQRRYPRERGDA
jgi:ribosome biogenesis GTPase